MPKSVSQSLPAPPLRHSAAGAAKLLGCSSDHVGTLIEIGELEAANIGLGTKRARYSISQDAIDAFLGRRIVKPKPVRTTKKRRTPASR